jgi:hypothetical protein
VSNQASFSKLSDESWGVKLSGGLGEATGKAGQTVEVHKRDGGSKTVVLGEQVEQWNGGRAAQYRIARRPSNPGRSFGNQPGGANVGRPTGTVTVTEPGVYELPDGTIYVVRPNQAKSRLYAKRLVEINAERALEEGGRVQIDFEYEKGAIFKIKPEHKMELERAKELTVRYGRCIVCGARLKDAKSVERGIGPVCIKSFAGAVQVAA